MPHISPYYSEIGISFCFYISFNMHKNADAPDGVLLAIFSFFRMRKRTFRPRVSGERGRIRMGRSCVHITKPQPIPHSKPQSSGRARRRRRRRRGTLWGHELNLYSTN